MVENVWIMNIILTEYIPLAILFNTEWKCFVNIPSQTDAQSMTSDANPFPHVFQLIFSPTKG